MYLEGCNAWDFFFLNLYKASSSLFFLEEENRSLPDTLECTELGVNCIWLAEIQCWNGN